MAERNAAVGYVALGKQSSPTTPVTPALYTPYYSTSLATDFNVASDEPVYGNRFKRFQSLKTSRKHGGSVEVMAEPNTAAYWLDMLSTKASTTGANPYTHTFGQSIATDPNSYTLDVSVGAQVIRYWGIQASKLGIHYYSGNNLIWERLAQTAKCGRFLRSATLRRRSMFTSGAGAATPEASSGIKTAKS